MRADEGAELEVGAGRKEEEVSGWILLARALGWFSKSGGEGYTG